MKLLSRLLMLSLTLLLVASCVPTKKYAALEQDVMASKRERDSLLRVADKNRFLQYDVQRLENQIEKDKANYTELSDRLAALSKNNQDLLFRYNQLLSQNNELLANTSDEKMTLTEELAAKQRQLDTKERELTRLAESIQQQESDVQRIREELRIKEEQLNNVDGQFDNYEQQLQELQSILQQKDAKLLALRQSVNQALLGFTDSDLSISEKNGKIYVSLSQNLLFASGSDKIDWKGKKAIIQVAQVLSSNPDILVNVEGHTDSDGNPSSNWDLSVRRATAVVEVITGQGIDPTRVTASGRAFYDPVAPNNSAVNKARNRRTEIILTPNLDQLYEIINK